MMKKTFFLFCIHILLFAEKGLAQTAPIPDPAFLNFLKSEYPSAINASNQLIIAQAATFNGEMNCSNKGIVSLEGIQYFTNIQFLHAEQNNINYLPDLSPLTKIETLNLKENQLTSIPSLSTMILLEKLFIANNKLTKIPSLTNNLNLIQLIAFSNLIDTLPPLNHLTNLDKIDVGGNKLTFLPDMSSLTKMEQLLIWDNKLDSIPNLTNYPQLWRLNAGGNKLAYTPDFSQNPRLKILFLDGNKLTALPDLSGLDSLDNVRFQNNNFDFLDLAPILTYPGKDTIFTYSPQAKFPGYSIYTQANDTMLIPSGIAAYGSTTYNWYQNGTLKYTTSTPYLKKIPASPGFYYVSATSSAFPGLNLKTDSFSITVGACLDLSGITFDIDGIKCLRSGEVWINSASLPSGNYTYALKGTVTNKVHLSNSGKFKNLTEPDYTLTIANDTCTTIYPSLVHIPTEECTETYITPNGDGDKDGFFFVHTGKVVIYDKQGRKVKSMDLPAEWDGTGNDGKLVPQGYYISNVNEGEELINISVIY